MTATETFTCRICGGAAAHTETRAVRDWEYGHPGEWDLLRCTQCGVVQIAPFPSLDELEQAYKVDYHGYAATAGKGALFRVLAALRERQLRAALAPLLPPDARVLDVGCGAGEFLERLRAFGAGWVEGIDFSDIAVELVRARGIHATRGTFLDFDAPPASYDLIVMNNYLEHTIEPAAELRKARALLKPGGTLFGEVPNFDSVDRRLFGRYWGGNHAPRHTFHFDRRALAALFRDAGFAEVRFHVPLNTGHFALSVQNWAQRNRTDLRHNPGLRHGRAWYYTLLLLALIPFNVPAALAGRAGFLDFVARA